MWRKARKTDTHTWISTCCHLLSWILLLMFIFFELLSWEQCVFLPWCSFLCLPNTFVFVFFFFFFFPLSLAVFTYSSLGMWKDGIEKALKISQFFMQFDARWFYCINKLLVGSLKACGISGTELFYYNPVIISLQYNFINTLWWW